MKRRLTTLGILVVAIAGPVAARAQDSKTVKGWHGAEWGMQFAELKSATGFDLVPATDGSNGACKAGTVGATLYQTVQPVDVDGLTTRPVFCVTSTGLVYIHFEFGDGGRSFSTIRDDLVGTYGQATSETRPAPDSIEIRTSKWVLQQTEITLQSFSSPSLRTLSLTYERRHSVL